MSNTLDFAIPTHFVFFFQAEDGIRDRTVTGVQTCALPIFRYRLMDVDIIFKRGLAYTAATAAVATVYFSLLALTSYLFHAPATGPVGGMIAIVIAAFLFQPLREWIQARLDRFFYRDRLDYRRTLIEFGRTLTNEVRLDPMLGSV